MPLDEGPQLDLIWRYRNDASASAHRAPAAQWLAYAFPCRRFAPGLVADGARLGASSCTRYCGVEVYSAIPFPGADRGFSALCGAISGRAVLAGLPHRCLRVQPIAPLRCTPQAAFAPSTWLPERGFIARRNAGRLDSGGFPRLPLLRPTASVKSKPSSFKNAPGRAIKAQSKRVFAQRMRGRAFQSIPFPSISGPESRLINGLRARGQQELFSFPPPPGRRPASFQKFRRREHRPCRPENLRGAFGRGR